MGNSSSKVDGPTAEVVLKDDTSQSASACPVSRKTADPDSGASACPVSSSSSRKVYNVYNQVIDTTNNMPASANQQGNLDKNRVSSSIPKGGTDASTWQYPSAQMFWNALVRKGKTEGAAEEDISDVIAVHNNMNETTWNQVMQWEGAAGSQPKVTKLLRFLGRPDDLSPKARIKMLFGHPAPFDRHDWYIDREDGSGEHRYVIDYYHDESNVSEDKRPLHKADTKSMKSIFVEVRPALDSFSALADRCLRVPFLRATKSPLVKGIDFIGLLPQKKMVEAEKQAFGVLTQQWAAIKKDCVQAKQALQDCGSDEDCSTASVELQRCTAGVVCPQIASSFDEAVSAHRKSGGGDSGAVAQQVETQYGKMSKCLEMFQIDSRNAMEKK